MRNDPHHASQARGLLRRQRGQSARNSTPIQAAPRRMLRRRRSIPIPACQCTNRCQACQCRTGGGEEATNKTYLQETSTSGNQRNSIAKSVERTASETKKLAICRLRPSQSENAESRVLMTSDTVSKKPRPRIPTNETSYVRKYHHMPAVSGALVSQMVLSASFDWTTTPRAPISSRTTPDECCLLPARWRACALEHRFDSLTPTGPSSERNCWVRALRAATSPKKKPAMLVTISSKGPREKME